MNWNRSPLAFEDVRILFDRALNSEKGIKIEQPTRSETVSLRARFNYYRKINRKENTAVYPPDHQLYGTSPYDTLILRIPPKGAPDEHVLYIEHRGAMSYKVEELK